MVFANHVQLKQLACAVICRLKGVALENAGGGRKDPTGARRGIPFPDTAKNSMQHKRCRWAPEDGLNTHKPLSPADLSQLNQNHAINVLGCLCQCARYLMLLASRIQGRTRMLNTCISSWKRRWVVAWCRRTHHSNGSCHSNGLPPGGQRPPRDFRAGCTTRHWNFCTQGTVESATNMATISPPALWDSPYWQLKVLAWIIATTTALAGRMSQELIKIKSDGPARRNFHRRIR